MDIPVGTIPKNPGMSYCWWLKSCTTWDVWNPIDKGEKLPTSTGAGFQPSTVRKWLHLQYQSMEGPGFLRYSNLKKYDQPSNQIHVPPLVVSQGRRRSRSHGHGGHGHGSRRSRSRMGNETLISPKKLVITRWWFQTFVCSSLFGEMIQFGEHIFQMGWFNHQLD